MTFLSWILHGFADFVLEASQTPHSRMTDVATILPCIISDLRTHMVRLVDLNPHLHRHYPLTPRWSSLGAVAESNDRRFITPTTQIRLTIFIIKVMG